MRKTKIFQGNQYVTSFVCDGKRYTKFQLFKRKVKFVCKRTLQVTAVSGGAVGLLYGGVLIGAAFNPTTSYARIENTVTVSVESTTTPIMERIAKCESGGAQTVKGQIVVHANTNGSADIGKYQVNLSTWGAKATSLGFDLSTEQGNHDMAYFIYHTIGTSPWASSAKCWSK